MGELYPPTAADYADSKASNALAEIRRLDARLRKVEAQLRGLDAHVMTIAKMVLNGQ